MTQDSPGIAAKPAASIVLLREVEKPGQNPLEVFMVLRHQALEVASGALVFPGGKVEKQDADDALINFYAPACVNKLASEPDHRSQLSFKVAAIREIFEETGVLFARHKGEQTLINAQTLSQLQGYRAALVNAELTISELLAEEKLSLASDLLLPYAHWITPKMAPKRFDTHFFVAELPENQIAVHDGEESVDSMWITPQALLKACDEGLWKMVFPTRMNIEKLAQTNSFAALTAQIEQFPPITIEPEFIDMEEGKFLCIPKEAGYPQWKVPIERVLKP